MSSPWWAAFPPAEARIRCGAEEHLLRWAGGRLGSAAHDDTEGELVLAALGGEQTECVAMLEAWGAHADDLDVLALGPRSPADDLAVTWELVDQLRALFGPAARSVPMRPGPAPGAARSGGPAVPGSPGVPPTASAIPGWASLRGGPRPRGRPLRGMPARRRSPEQERAQAQRVELLSLFALGRPFQQRLSAQVAAAWSAGGATGGPAGDAVSGPAGGAAGGPTGGAVSGPAGGAAGGPAGGARDPARARPALVAALAGRLAPAAGPWAGVDPDAVQVTLHEAAGWGRVERDGPALRAALPLSWLARIWAPGFPVVDGHLVVDVLDGTWPRMRVLGLAAPGTEPAVLSIQPDGEHWSRARGGG